MPIVRKSVQKGFTIVPNATVRDKTLNLKDRGMICYLLSLPDGWEFSIKGLSAMMPNDGDTTIKASLNRLEELGYLERTRNRDKSGKVREAIWTIYDRPHKPKTIEPTDQNAEKPKVENPTLENRTQINKDYKKEPNIDKQEGIRSNCSNYKLEDIYRENQKIESLGSVEEQSSHQKNRAAKPPVSRKGRKPTVEEISEYCSERSNGIDPEEFYDFYEANGWIQGKGKPIQDWKAAVRTWERRSRQNGIGQSSRKNNGNPFMDMICGGDEIVNEQEPDFGTSGNASNRLPFSLPERGRK